MTEAQLLAVLRYLKESGEHNNITLRDLADLYTRAFSVDVDVPITPRQVGNILRKRLGLRPQKSHGVYVVSAMDSAKIVHLLDRYGVSDEDAARIAEFDPTRALELTFEPIEPPR